MLRCVILGPGLPPACSYAIPRWLGPWGCRRFHKDGYHWTLCYSLQAEKGPPARWHRIRRNFLYYRHTGFQSWSRERVSVARFSSLAEHGLMQRFTTIRLEDGQCAAAVIGRDIGGGMAVVGDAFLRGFYTVYDMGNNQVGLAPAV